MYEFNFRVYKNSVKQLSTFKVINKNTFIYVIRIKDKRIKG